MTRQTGLATIAVLVSLTAATSGQWVKYPSAGIPRLPDGKPNLTAPAPKLADGKPDLSGIWDVGNMLYFHDLGRGLKPGEIQLTEWAASVQKIRRDRNHVDDPYGYCLPLGVPRESTRSPFKIIQTPSLTILLHESFVGNTFRQVFMDGRPLPKLSDVEPAWLGYSVGKYEGDTLVVDSIGFRDGGWLSANMAYPNSDQLHVTERFKRTDFGHIALTVTIDDPKAFVKPWTNTIPLTFQADTELLDSYCDNQMQILKTWSYPKPSPEPPSPK
jgi:hypothetical protein